MKFRWMVLGLTATAVAAAGIGPATATVRAPEPADTAHRVAGPAPVAAPFAGRRGMAVESGRAVGVRPTVTTSARSTQQLTLTGIDRAGQVITGGTGANVVNLDTGEGVYVRLNGPTAVSVPTGRFAISATVATPLAVPSTWSQTLVLLSEVAVSGAVDVTLDARRGEQAVLRPDDATATQVEGGAFVVQQTGGGPVAYPAFPATSAPEQLFLTPTGTRSDLKLHLLAQWVHRDVRPSPYLYGLVHTTAGIAQRPGHQVRRDDLATVSTRYAAQVAPACGGVYLGPVLPDTPGNVLFGLPLPTLPTTRVEHLSPGVRWQADLGHGDPSCQGEFDTQFSRPVSYPRPGRYTASWNTAPFGPAADQDDAPAQRHGDVIRVRLPMFADSQAGHFGSVEPAGAIGTTTLSRDGGVIGTSPSVGDAEFAVPAGPGGYQLSVRCTREVTWSKLATEQEATWTFTAPAGGADPDPLPLLTVRAMPSLDEYNRAPGGAVFAVPLRVTRTSGAPVAPTARVTVEISYDEGRTWRPASVVGAGDRWAATLHHPATGTVSLRMTAVDGKGNAVTQTMIRAYGLRA